MPSSIIDILKEIIDKDPMILAKDILPIIIKEMDNNSNNKSLVDNKIDKKTDDIPINDDLCDDCLNYVIVKQYNLNINRSKYHPSSFFIGHCMARVSQIHPDYYNNKCYKAATIIYSLRKEKYLAALKNDNRSN